MSVIHGKYENAVVFGVWLCVKSQNIAQFFQGLISHSQTTTKSPLPNQLRKGKLQTIYIEIIMS